MAESRVATAELVPGVPVVRFVGARPRRLRAGTWGVAVCKMRRDGALADPDRVARVCLRARPVTDRHLLAVLVLVFLRSRGAHPGAPERCEDAKRRESQNGRQRSS